MLKKNTKRKRTRAQIEEEKQEEVLKKQRLAADMAELVTLRSRIEAAEQLARNNEAAAQVMHHLVNAGHVKQDFPNTVAINTSNGIQRFSAEGQEPEVQIDFEADDGANDM